jgi:CRISPR-associated endoribonuclease Cas6
VGLYLRLKLTLRAPDRAVLMFNYNYPLSAAIYNLLRFGSPEFARFLHDIGYKLNGKSYKLFTFALRFEKFRIQNSSISLLSNYAHLYISSPLIDEFVQNFVIGTFESQKIELAAKDQKTIFEIAGVESLPEIEYKEEMYFKLLAPIILSTKKEHKGRLIPYYFRYNDDLVELNRIFNNNLKNKYELITGSASADKNVSFEWDYNYIKTLEAKGKRLTKKQTIKEGTPEQTEVIGNLIPFTVKGDVDLLKVGYECGFGEKNSLGFGMADTD